MGCCRCFGCCAYSPALCRLYIVTMMSAYAASTAWGPSPDDAVIFNLGMAVCHYWLTDMLLSVPHIIVVLWFIVPMIQNLL